MKAMIKMAGFAAAMTGFLAVMVIGNALARAGGTEVEFDMAPRDPRDLLLGHYSIVGLDIHSLEPHALAGDDAFETGDIVFVALEIGEDGAALPAALYRERPDDGLFIQGRAAHVSRVFTDTAEGETRAVRIRAVYGLERYYAARDAAQALDAELRGESDIRLIVSIGDDGAAVIKGLSLNGERRYDSLWD